MEGKAGIAKALVMAQKNFAPALKTHTNPHFKSRYADLSACVEAVIDALNSAGIALIQKTHEAENGVIVETVFLHESGETMNCGKLLVPASKQDPQGYGSALTYARRYSLMAACGIAPEDDDGNAAAKKHQAEANKKTEYLSADQVIAVSDAAKERGLTVQEICKRAKVQELESIEASRFDGLIKWIETFNPNEWKK